MKAKVVLDTNFLMIPGQFKVDIFEELKRIISFPYDVCVFSATIDELNEISTKNSRDKNNAKIALNLIKQKNLKTLQGSGSYTDDIILNNVDTKCIVCTQDKALKRLLKQKGIQIITLKSKKYLAFEVKNVL
jgi:rRNA-processing protein FCF1